MTPEKGAMPAATARWNPARRAIAVLPGVALALALSACGGAAVYVSSDGGVAFFVTAFFDGSTVGHPVHSGEAMTVSIQVGQSIEFDASGVVVWRFSVNGGPFLPAGSTVSPSGLAITVAPVGASRVRVSTTVTGGFASAANVTLTATSSVDQRDVATVQLQVR
jgi:hypothetical protein